MAQDYSKREFPMTDKNFSVIQDVAYKMTGITISDKKKEMIYSRISRRIRDLGLSNFDQYCATISEENSPEKSDFINAITTNLTSFFREQHHFDYLNETVLPAIKEASQFGDKVRIWSAGCSTGEEPYSIAITIKESGLDKTTNLKILATDLDSNVLATAQKGVYDQERVKGLQADKKRRWFTEKKSTIPGEKLYEVNSSVKELITFKRLNLLEKWPMSGQFDIVFCRNVIIYFDKNTQRALFGNFAQVIKPNANLFIGHSETLTGISNQFTVVGKTIYQRTER